MDSNGPGSVLKSGFRSVDRSVFMDAAGRWRFCSILFLYTAHLHLSVEPAAFRTRSWQTCWRTRTHTNTHTNTHTHRSKIGQMLDLMLSFLPHIMVFITTSRDPVSVTWLQTFSSLLTHEGESNGSEPLFFVQHEGRGAFDEEQKGREEEGETVTRSFISERQQKKVSK